MVNRRIAQCEAWKNMKYAKCDYKYLCTEKKAESPMAVEELYGPERARRRETTDPGPERFLLVSGRLTPRVRQWPRNKKPVGTQFT